MITSKPAGEQAFSLGKAWRIEIFSLPLQANPKEIIFNGFNWFKSPTL